MATPVRNTVADEKTFRVNKQKRQLELAGFAEELLGIIDIAIETDFST